MIKTSIGTIPLWQFELFTKQATIQHFISGREGGFSNGEFGSLNLSYMVGDDTSLVLKNRSAIANAFGIEVSKFIIPTQTHTNTCKIITSATKQEELENVDAVITNEKGILIAVMSADCVPILLYDQEKQVVAAVHAGWRGTVAEILKKTVETMQHSFGSNTTSIIAGIGPSISDEVYEVGEEVMKGVDKVYGTMEGIISNEKNGKGFCNLWEANRIQLLKLGVKEENIEVAGICTYSNSSDFFSYRKFGTKAGRFAAGIMLT